VTIYDGLASQQLVKGNEMAQATDAKPTRRSWTDGKDQPKNRFIALVFLSLSVAILFSVFLWFVFYWGKKGETFFLPLSVGSYADGIPKANYGVWDQDLLTETAKTHGLKPWTFSLEEKLENRPQIEDRLTRFINEIQRIGREPEKTTVLVQLRCHAVVANDGNAWTCGLFVGESSTKDAMFPLVDFLKQLQTIPANNIVLFADVCDVKSVPSKGWITNPVASYINKACEKLESRAGKSLWIACAADDYQETFYSDARRKTLFQEACEDALQHSNGKDCNLNDYFESIFRYCYTASGGRQTPKLILSNGNTTKTFDAQFDSKLQKLAKQVIIGHRSPLGASIPKSPKVKVDGAAPATKTSRNDRILNAGGEDLVRPVSLVQDKVGADSKGSKPIGDPIESKLDDDEAVAFWQIRDRVHSRGQMPLDKGMRWSPADFAPMLWRKWQIDAAMDPAVAKKHFEELKELEKLLVAVVPKEDSSATDQMLVRAWNDFLATNQSLRSLWQGEGDMLTESESMVWTSVRKKICDYIDALSELGFWFSLDCDDPIYRKEWEELLSCLERAKVNLPLERNESANEKTIDMQIANATQARLQLRKWLSDRCRQLESKKGALTWLDEREFQNLLASPLLTHSQRKSLLTQRDTRTKNLGLVSEDRDTDFKKLLESVAPLTSKAERACNELIRLAAFCGTKVSVPASSNEERYLALGREYEIAMRAEANSPMELEAKSKLSRWHFLSIADTNFGKPSEWNLSFAGIVVSPVDPSWIRLSLPAGAVSLDFADTRDDSELRVNVKRIDGSNVPECSLRWSTSVDVPDFSISVNGKPFAKGSPMKIQPRSKQSILVCQFPRTGKIPEGLTLNLKLVGEKSSEVTVPILRDAEQIDIVATRVHKNGRNLNDPSLQSVENKELTFAGPAIAGTTSRFAFALRNKKTTPRRAKLQVYVSPALDDSVVDSESILMAESEIVSLPVSRQVVSVKLTSPKDQLAPVGLKNAKGSTLTFKIVEYELESAASNQETVEAKTKGRPFEYVGLFDPKRPSPNYIKVNPSEVKDGRPLSVAFEITPDFLDRYEVAGPIPIVGEVTLRASSKPETTSDLLGPTKLKAEIRGPIMDIVSNYQLAFDIGGFPRAIVYKAGPKSADMQEENLEQFEIVDVTVKRQGKEQQPKKLDRVANRVIVPNRIGKEFERANWESLEIQSKMDVFSEPCTLEIASVSGTTLVSNILKHDRSYEAELKIDRENGTLQVGFKASELRLQPFPGLDDSLNGVYFVKQSFQGEKATALEIVFDRDKPEPGAKIICKDRVPELYIGESLELSMEPTDAGSGIQSVQFARVPANVDNPSFASPQAEMLDPKLVSYDEGKATISLDSKELELRPSVYFYVVARTIDKAGNYQDDNGWLKIRWNKQTKSIKPK